MCVVPNGALIMTEGRATSDGANSIRKCLAKVSRPHLNSQTTQRNISNFPSLLCIFIYIFYLFALIAFRLNYTGKVQTIPLSNIKNLSRSIRKYIPTSVIKNQSRYHHRPHRHLKLSLLKCAVLVERCRSQQLSYY